VDSLINENKCKEIVLEYDRVKKDFLRLEEQGQENKEVLT